MSAMMRGDEFECLVFRRDKSAAVVVGVATRMAGSQAVLESTLARACEPTSS